MNTSNNPHRNRGKPQTATWLIWALTFLNLASAQDLLYLRPERHSLEMSEGTTIVGGFNALDKICASQIGSSPPKIGVKISFIFETATYR